MSTNRSKGRSSLCSFTFAAGRHCRTLECGAITLRALCAPVSVPSVVNPFPRSRPSPISAKRFCLSGFHALTDFLRLQIGAKARLSDWHRTHLLPPNRTQSTLTTAPPPPFRRCSGGSSESVWQLFGSDPLQPNSETVLLDSAVRWSTSA